MADFAKDENKKNARFLTRNASFIPLKEAETRFDNILFDFHHRKKPLINIWGKPLGDP